MFIVNCKKKKSYMLIGLEKKIDSLMFKVLKSIHINLYEYQIYKYIYL